MHTKNLTVMFVDMKGFTCLMASYSRKQVSYLLHTLEEIIRPTVEEFKGQVIKALGDGYIVIFDSPTNAVLCGLKIQEAVSNHNAVSPSTEFFELRMAVHLGEVTLRNGDIFGEPVNLASRIEKVAEPGEVYLTEAVFLAMNQNEVPVKKVGRGKLKGMAGNIEVYKVASEQSEVIKNKILRSREALASYFLPKDRLTYSSKLKKKHFSPKRQLGYFAMVLVVFGTGGLLAASNEERSEKIEPKLLITEPAIQEKKPDVQGTQDNNLATPTPQSEQTPVPERGRGKGKLR
jgi:class 3 adenylate cyclase